MNLIKSIRKNSPEVQALISGRMPSFIYGKKTYSDIPVFCYHEADLNEIESHLMFIAENGYRTLTADEYYSRVTDPDYVNDGKDILLTFDDGLASVWTTGFPLFQRYKVKIVLFVLPGLIEEGAGVGKTIDDDCDGETYKYIIDRDRSPEPLCNWQELVEMHNSGFVDIQSHSMKHSLVSVSPKVVDFIHPDFDVNNYANVHIPEFSSTDNVLIRDKVLGHPVYESKPRLLGYKRFKDDYSVRKRCADFVGSQGGEVFFSRQGWRELLEQEFSKFKTESVGYETEQELTDAIVYELKQSKLDIERRLNTKTVNHFCFPWFAVSEKSAKLAYEAGYKAIYLGATPGFHPSDKDNMPYLATRLQKEYLKSLPGKGHKNLIQIMMAKLKKKRL